MKVEVRGQSAGVESLHPPRSPGDESPDINCWQQAPLRSE